MTTATELTRHLDTALAATGDIAGMLQSASFCGTHVKLFHSLDSAVADLAEADMCGEHGGEFACELRAAADEAGRLVQVLQAVDCPTLAVVLALEDARTVLDSLHGAIKAC